MTSFSVCFVVPALIFLRVSSFFSGLTFAMALVNSTYGGAWETRGIAAGR